MPSYRIRDAADLLGVSDDSLRRWIDGGRLAVTTDDTGRRTVEGTELARFAQLNAPAVPEVASIAGQSARNRLLGLVTKVTRDTVMAQVELQCGAFRVVSLMSREAADDLGLEPGVTAVAAIKATNVVVEIPEVKK